MNNLASERVRIGKSQAELAEVIGVDRITVSRWETGEYEVPTARLKQLSGIFGCSIDYLLGMSVNRV